MVQSKDRFMSTWKWASVNYTRDQRTRVTTTRNLFPHDSKVTQSGKQNLHHLPSYQATVYQLSWVHQRKVVHQGASFLSLQSVCMYTVRKTCESCFKSIIYKCLFYLSVSDSLQNLSKPNVSMCLATFLSVLETWLPTTPNLHTFPLQT